MHHAIKYQHHWAQGLQVGARKRAPQGLLFRITQGAALLKLGQQELLLTSSQCFWLPADLLAAFSPLANCRYDQLSCSIRMPQPSQAGWLMASPLLHALLDNLANWTRDTQWHGPYGQRLQLILDELCQCTINPKLETPLQQAWQALIQGHHEGLAQWQSTAPAELDAAQISAQWQLLQALRLCKGGQSASLAASKMGYPDSQALADACQRWHVVD